MKELEQVSGDNFISQVESISNTQNVTFDQAILLLIAEEINALRLEVSNLKDKLDKLSDSATKK
ncbi:hypothetical protein [Ornithobacterium rhinotracheale]